jgi:predicted ATPase
MSAALAAHDAILAAAIEEHDGYVFSRGGDAYAAAFARATDALDAAVAARRNLAAREWGETEIRVRAGIHTGEAEERGGDYFGQALNRAARLMAVAHGGQIVLSGQTAELIGARVPGGCRLVDRGAHVLKDVPDPVRIHEVVDDRLPYEPPSLRTPQTGNLPATLTELVGRDAQLSELVELVGEVRLVTLTGPGGVGKTRLSLEVAERMTPVLPDGAWFVGLSEISEPALVVKQLANALSIQERADEPVLETVVSAVRDRQLLLVLDNCEHLLDDAAELVQRLIASAPGLRVLATSRAPLGLTGERQWLVPTLTLPQPDADPLTSPAVRLFLDRARLVMRDFEPDESELADCVEICRRVDGLPLAIELAAARVTVLAPGEIADRLGDRIDLLAGSARDLERRQQTMRAAVAWSHDLLSEEERVTFRSLAVFRGGFTLDAARAVVDPDGSVDAVASGVEHLLNQSLLQASSTAGSRRFAMLETVRAHATERLEASGEADEMLRRHRDHFIGFAAEEAKLLTTSAQLESLDRLEADHDNLRAVMARTFAAGDVEAAVGVAADLSFFWWLHAHFAESAVWYDRLMGSASRVSERSQAKFLLGAGQIAIGVRDYDRAARLLQKARRLATQAEAPRVAAWAMALEMTMASYRLRLDEARDISEQAMEAFDSTGDVAGAGYVSFVRVAIDFVEAWTGDALSETVTDELLRRLEPVAAGAAMLGERNFLGHVNELIGSIHLLVGRRGQAVAPLRNAIESLDALGSQSCLAHAIERVALFAARAGDLRASVELTGAAGSVRRGIGARRSEAEEEVRRRILDMARANLSVAEVDGALELGGSTSRSDAVELALSALDSA